MVRKLKQFKLIYNTKFNRWRILSQLDPSITEDCSSGGIKMFGFRNYPMIPPCNSSPCISVCDSL